MTFVSESSRASLFLFSTYDIVSAILDNPEEYDFAEDDVTQEAGAIWQDELHLTTEVHAILAERLKCALKSLDSDLRLPSLKA